jgi:dTDP-glucose pyrophosphorylase
MKAVILAAGKGTRMRELTQATPKPMLKVQGKPILQHIVEGLVSAEIREICIITGYQAETIEDFFANGEKFGAQITYARQYVQDGTGKAPELAKGVVGASDFLLTYGDILVKPETYAQMKAKFSSGPYSGLITVTKGEDVTKGGLNFFDEGFCLTRVVEKPNPAQVADYKARGWLREGAPVWYNAGIYIFKPEVFDYTSQLQKSPRGEYELPDAINAMVENGRKIAGLEIVGRWVDVRDPEVLQSLENGLDAPS